MPHRNANITCNIWVFFQNEPRKMLIRRNPEDGKRKQNDYIMNGNKFKKKKKKT